MDTVSLASKSFDSADEVRTPPNARIEIVKLGGHSLARVQFDPGWRWSENIKPIAGTDSCQFTHVGTAIRGRLRVRLDDGTETDIGAGDAYTIPPGHDGWVVGDEPFVGLEMTPDTIARFAAG